jgi:hypothetical protein
VNHRTPASQTKTKDLAVAITVKMETSESLEMNSPQSSIR